jgi:hypothetical protein
VGAQREKRLSAALSVASIKHALSRARGVCSGRGTPPLRGDDRSGALAFNRSPLRPSSLI